MKSIQTKLRIAIMVLLLFASAVFLLLAATMSRRLIDNYSDKLLLLSVERAGLELDTVFSASQDDSSVDPEEVKRIVTSAAVYENGNAFLLDTDGNVIFSTKIPKGIKTGDMNDLQKDFFSRAMTNKRNEVSDDQRVMNGHIGKIVVVDLKNPCSFPICHTK